MIPQVYRDVDILKSLGRIVDQHTKEFKEDFELGKKIILKMAQSPDENDHHLIWMCRPLGTHCFAERDVFLENTFENRGLYAYHSEKPNKNLLYALHLKRNDGETVKGDIYTLDYAKEVERVSLLSCPVTQVTLYFADGKEITVPYESFHDAIHELTPKHGAIDSFRYRPESEAELGLILRRLHIKRDRQANVGDFEQHIESLQKSSVRNKLQRAKSEVKPSEPKPPKKKEPSL